MDEPTRPDAGELLKSMFVLTRSALIYELNNEALKQAARRLAEVANAVRAQRGGDAVALSIDTAGADVGGTPVALDATSFDYADYLEAVWSALGIGRIAASGDTSARDWLELASALKAALAPGGRLDALLAHRFPALQIGAPRSDEAQRALRPASAVEIYAALSATTAELCRCARDARPLPLARLKRALQDLVGLEHESAPLLAALALTPRNQRTVADHLANTAVVTALMASRLPISRPFVRELAIRAALCDLGAANASHDRQAAGPRAERAIASAGVAALAREGSSPRALRRLVVASEVRRWADPSAEPPGDDAGRSPSAASRLVAAARAFSLLTSATEHRPALRPDDAMKVLARDAGRRYDTFTVKLLLATLGVYPLGSAVALSDGAVGVVAALAPADAGDPTRATVAVVRDPRGVELSRPMRLDLARPEHAERAIDRCGDPAELDLHAPAVLLRLHAARP